MNAGTRIAALAATTLVVAACGGGGSGAAMNAPPTNTGPSISSIANQSADQDTSLAIDFGVDDHESGPGSLMVAAAADGSALFPADGVVLSGSGGARTLTLTPLEAATGTASIGIQVTDPQGAVTTRNFSVAVNAKNNSMRAMALDTFAKSETDTATALNGWTVQQDADDPAIFAPLIPADDLPSEGP